MKIKQMFIIAIVIATGLSSCGVTVNPSGYYNLSQEYRARIMKCDKPIDSLAADGNIYQVDVNRMHEYLNNHDEVIVYEYRPFCTGENCIAPSLAVRTCKDNGYDVALVMLSYEKFEALKPVKVPVLAINNELYNTDNYNRYGKLFFNELTGTTMKERGEGLYYYFKKGEFVKAYRSIDEAVAKDSIKAAYVPTGIKPEMVARTKSQEVKYKKIMAELDFGAGLKQHNITPMFVGLNLGYYISPRLYAYARYEGLMGLSKVDGVQNYFKSTNLGGGIGYVLGVIKETNDMSSVRLQVTNSVGNVDWKNTTYTIGIYSHRRLTRNGSWTPVIGLGFKHINSHTIGIRDCNSVFATIGFGF